MKKFAIVVAGGKGLRFDAGIPKQFQLLNGKPLLMYPVEKFYAYNADLQIIIVLPAEQIDYWRKLCKDYNFNVKHKIVIGGETRFQSVKNGLSAIDEEGIVAVHDGVRPLVSIKTIEQAFKTAQLKGTAVPVIHPVDSMRELTPFGSMPVNRNSYKFVQTPQVFKISILKEAYKQDYNPDFTDDASVVEIAGFSITLVEGNAENIKITSKSDLAIAEALVKNRNLY
jgi:2-C-methyl-D-erythritol 4-phosphate cytidylyltransferase